MTKLLRLMLIDDEEPARQRLRAVLGDLAAELPHEIVSEASNGRQALVILETVPADVVLVDIHMPQMSGMEFARHLLRGDKSPALIFVTAHDAHAIQAFEVNALDYLLKPVRGARLLSALQKAQVLTREKLDAVATQAAEGPRRFLSIAERGRIQLVPVSDILYLRAELKYVTLKTSEREYLIEESLTALEQEFGESFVRIHRSCLVARDRVRGFERASESDEGAGWAVLLDGCAEKLAVSRRQWPHVKGLAGSR
ncbi:MAG TPA: LytTR family DNA-binding domain-containing protein [Burkholderiales bacterium]|nr:LytTR family DNA-binding domain-containing protein [Burkholderiales bacterium]